MNSWINLNALWKIVVIGLLAGAGLPALFAIGLRVLAPRGRSTGATGSTGSTDTALETTDSTTAKLIAGLCFLAVIAAMAWGVYSIVHNS